MYPFYDIVQMIFTTTPNYTESTRLLSFIYNGKIGDDFMLLENNYKDHSILNTFLKNIF